MAEDTVARHTRTQTTVHVFDALIEAWEHSGTIGLTIPTPRCEGDDSRVVAYLERDGLQRLHDDIRALLARLEG